MNDIELVIKIPEEIYIEKKEDYIGDTLDKAITNGTPLPKGHGQLIDADRLVKTFKERKAFYVSSWGGFKNMPKSDKARCDETDNCISDVINAPTIIEADKENKE